MRLANFLQMTAHRRAEICYNTSQTIQDFAFDASFGSGETWKILLREPTKWRMRPYGRIFFRGFSQGIPGPHQNCGRGLRPLSFAATGTRAEERMAIGTSEKLAQEGLRGNRDRLAVGKRVSPCVRKVAHDLERMRGAGGLRHQYQTDRWVRMA